ncbi:MAG: hypothetical protein FIB08_04145 [Candidatus Methanoperedens sp.]|nr:hypothetical protein [Candidatus Methanoperedens sp.]
MEEISFEQMPQKPTPEIKDSTQQEMVEKAEKSIAQSQIKQELKEEVIEVPVYDSVPVELPEMIFHMGSKWVECPKMELDEKEKTIMAKHISNLIGHPSSKIFSLLIVLVVTFSKITECKNAILSKLGKTKTQ